MSYASLATTELVDHYGRSIQDLDLYYRYTYGIHS